MNRTSVLQIYSVYLEWGGRGNRLGWYGWLWGGAIYANRKRNWEEWI